MKTYLPLLLALFVVSTLIGQSTSFLHGKVVDAKGTPIFAANVYWKNQTQQGTTTDFDGLFKLPVTEVADTLVVSFLGYQTLTVVSTTFDPKQILRLTLRAATQDFAAVLITAKTPISEQYAVTQLERLDIYLNPVAQGDPLKAITALPASTTADETANPSLRGSAADRSRVVLNGVPIYRPVRNSQFNGLGNFSIFNTALVDKMYVYASNPPLTYGNTSAGLVEIQTTKQLEQDQYQLSATLASLGGMLSKKLGEQAFVQAYSNYQFAGPFLALNEKSLRRLNDFKSIDAGLHLNWSVSPKTTLNSFTYAIDESYDYTFQLFNYEGPSQAGKRRLFSVNTLRHELDKGVLSWNNGTNHSTTNFTFGNLHSVQQSNQWYTALDYKYFLSNEIVLQTGINHDYRSSRFENTFPSYYYAFAPEMPVELDTFRATQHNLEAYLYGTWKWGKQWSFSAGLRSNVPTAQQSHYLSSQLGIRFTPGSKHSFLLSGGQYHSYTTPSFEIQQFQLLVSRQIALDYEFKHQKTQLNGAIFLKRETGDQTVSNVLFTDDNRIFGLELALQQQLGKYLEFNLANTFLNHAIALEGTRYKGQYDFNYFLKASLQFTHYRWPSLNLSYIGRPGQYFTPINGATFVPSINTFEPSYSTEFFSGQLSGYHRIDFAMSKYFKFRSGSIVGFMNLANVLNIQNESSVLYNQDYSQFDFDYYTLRTLFFGVVWQFE